MAKKRKWKKRTKKPPKDPKPPKEKKQKKKKKKKKKKPKKGEMLMAFYPKHSETMLNHRPAPVPHSFGELYVSPGLYKFDADNPILNQEMLAMCIVPADVVIVDVIFKAEICASGLFHPNVNGFSGYDPDIPGGMNPVPYANFWNTGDLDVIGTAPTYERMPHWDTPFIRDFFAVAQPFSYIAGFWFAGGAPAGQVDGATMQLEVMYRAAEDSDRS